MKPHGQAHHSPYMLKQGSESEETPPEEASLPGTSLKKGSSVEADPPKCGLGRGSLLKLCQSSVFVTATKVGDQGHGKSDVYSLKSSIKNISKEVHKINLGKRQEIPDWMIRSTSRSSSSSSETFSPKERRPATAKSAQAKRHPSKSSLPSRERRPATVQSTPEDRPASKSSLTSRERRPPTVQSTPEDRPASKSSLPSRERGKPTVQSAQEERPASKSSLPSRERGPPTAQSALEERPGSRSWSSSREELVSRERRPLTVQSTPEDRPASKSSPTSRERRPPTMQSTPEDRPASKSSLTSRERRPPTVQSTPEDRPASKSSLPSRERGKPTVQSALEEKPGSRSWSSSREELVSRERRPPTVQSVQEERPASKSSQPARESGPPTAQSALEERPGSRSWSSSREELVSRERRPPTVQSTPEDRPTSKSSQPARERGTLTVHSALEERPGSRSWSSSREELVSRERRPPTVQSTPEDRPASKSSQPARERGTPTVHSAESERPEQTVDEFSLRKKSVSHLLTNYVKLQTDPNLTVYEYEVTFSPDVEFKNFRFRLLYDHFKGKKDILCYDGGSKLFTPQRITDDVEEFIVHHPVSKNTINMGVKLKKKAESKDCAVVYNTLFNNCSRILKFTRFGNKYFDAEEAVNIPQHKLEIWPGYVTAIDDFDGGIQLRCDINHRVLRTETVLEVLTSFSRRGPENVKAMVLRDLIGQCVMTRYNNNMYRIDDIDWSRTPLSTFTLKNGEEISFLEYYKRQYNIEITDVKQPLIINMAKDGRGGKKNFICLVPEICFMTGLNDKMRTDFKVMKDIARYTRITPNQRIYAFKKFLENMKNNEEVQSLLNKWGLRITDDLVQVKAKNLELESLVFGNDTTFKAVNYDWMRSLRDLNVYRSVDIKSWIILYPSRNRNVADDFMNIIKKTGPGLGVVIEPPTKIPLPDDRVETYINSLKENIKSHTQIVVCICPTAREDRYNAIKKLCCKEIPVPSQVVNVVTLSREDRVRSVVQNIALQMNHKIGGAGWAIQIPFNRTMVCGVDTYHEKNHASKSVGAFVASTSNDCTEWFSRTNFQGPKEELISGLVSAFTSALLFYHKKNGAFPDHIVVFRDGVSDGQLDTCMEFEVPQLLNVFTVVAKSNYRPNFLYVIVQKRIATKLYKKVDEGVENPRPGGVVDSVITKKDYVDFYLVSQLVRNGTASPTHYIVLYDNSNASLDYVQRLTYKFCHLYYNWPGTIRVPAPCQYAHKLAYLVGQNIKCVPDKSLQDKLFYL